jgi:DNA replication and repair protein RecF
MLLNTININFFRNIKQSEISFDSRFNIFYGKNGQGKTNYLEAIFFLGTLKSFRHARQKDMLAWNENTAYLKCSVTDNELQHDLSLSFENSSKILKVDGKTSARMIDYCHLLSVVAFSPEEMTMINGSPDQRRRYLDRAVFCNDPGYLKVYHDYYRVLKQRNQLLKLRNYSGIEAWTDQLVSTGARLVLERSSYIRELAEPFSDYHKNISGSDEEASLCYHNPSFDSCFSLSGIRDEFIRALNVSSRIERDRGTTVVGPHRDDLEFFLNDRPIREHGSQGQQKSFVMALKMAEIDHLNKTSGRLPVLLLDDMTAELDSNRIRHLLDFLISKNIQVFITTTDPASVPLSDSTRRASFLVEEGRIV